MKNLLKYNWFIIVIAAIFVMPLIIDTKKSPTSDKASKKTESIIEAQPVVVEQKNKNFKENKASAETAAVIQPTLAKQDKKAVNVKRLKSDKEAVKVVEQPTVLVRSDLSGTEELQAGDSNLKHLMIQNKCTKKNFGYKHWTGTYYPSNFVLKMDNKVVLTFNGKEFQYPTNKIALSKGQTLKARFDWAFLGGRRSGWKEIEFKINENADRLDLSFDWKSEQKDAKNDPWQLTIAQATPIKQTAAENK